MKTPTSRPKRDRWAAALEALAPMTPECYVDGDNNPGHEFSWCGEHADMVARVEALTAGTTLWACRSDARSDVVMHCEWRGCGIVLRPGGGLTDAGVDSALGITEEKVLKCHTYPAELFLSYMSMSSFDPRWPLWDWHACKLLKKPLPEIEEHTNCGGVILFEPDKKYWQCTRCHNICTLHVGTTATCMTCMVEGALDVG